MTTNPIAALRMLITYAICIPVAILLGYTLTDVSNNPNYSNIFIVGLSIGFLFLPILIKWHYPIMIFGLSCPVTLFFLKGSPPLGQVLVIISLGIAIVERATSHGQRRFISAPSMTWAMIYTLVMAGFTAFLTGGIGLHALGAEGGGGKKYILLLTGILTFFALTSRTIPKERRNLYVALYLLSGLPAFIGDLSAIMPAPLSYVGLLIKPSVSADRTVEIGVTRLATFGTTASVVTSFMLAKFGLRGIFGKGNAWWRLPFFMLMLALTLLGGFRTVFLTYLITCCLMFFMEGLQKTRLLPAFLFAGIVGVSLLVPFAEKLPYTFQRALSVLPLHLDQAAVDDAEGSSEWRLRIWRAYWPQVPQYLLLGKGYVLTADDMQMLGRDSAFATEGEKDATQVGLAVAGDYHNGPLSTLMPFGIWGAISIVWIAFAGLRILYRNYKYGDMELRTVNTFLLANHIWQIIRFSFVFGAYGSDVTYFSMGIGFSLALNWGVCGPQTNHHSMVAPQPEMQALLRARPLSA